MSTAPHIFICFSSKDAAVARDVVDFFEREGIKCWVSLRDVPAGHNYQENIVQAIEASRGMIFLFSSSSNASEEVKKELSVAASLGKPVFPIRLEPVTPNGALRYELAIRQWIDVFADRERGFRTLAETIRNTVAEFAGAALAPSPPAAPVSAPVVSRGTPEFDDIRILLARHIGPIAKILVETAAQQTRTPDEFCARLAGNITDASERAAFLQAARARLAVKF